MEVLLGKSTRNGPFSIAIFDYQRAMELGHESLYIVNLGFKNPRSIHMWGVGLMVPSPPKQPRVLRLRAYHSSKKTSLIIYDIDTIYKYIHKGCYIIYIHTEGSADPRTQLPNLTCHWKWHT